MKIIVVTGNEKLGEALGEQKRSSLIRRRALGGRSEDFACEVIREYRNVEGATDVAFVRVDELSADDAARIANATTLAECGDRKAALAQLEACSDGFSRAWIDARQRIDFIAPPTDEALSPELRLAVSRRAEVLNRLFESYKGGFAALAREKDASTPGPGTLLAFHRYVAETGRLPINDFGVTHLGLEAMPRGAHSHHVGWMHHLYDRPALFLDVAWWYTLDVIGLFSGSRFVRDGAVERIVNVPRGLCDWRGFQLRGNVHDAFDVDADIDATKELEAIVRGET